MFISKKQYEEEKKLADLRITEFEKTLHELYEEHLELRNKYNQLLADIALCQNTTDKLGAEQIDILARLDAIEHDMRLRNGDKNG